MIEVMIGLVAWVSVGAADALAVGRASAIGSQGAVHCRLAKISRR